MTCSVDDEKTRHLEAGHTIDTPATGQFTKCETSFLRKSIWMKSIATPTHPARLADFPENERNLLLKNTLRFIARSGISVLVLRNPLALRLSAIF